MNHQGRNIKARVAEIGRRIASKTIGLAIHTVAPGCPSWRRHKHALGEEILIVMSGTGMQHHTAKRIPADPGDCGRYLPEDPEPRAFENTRSSDLVIGAFSNRFPMRSASIPTGRSVR